LVFQGKDAVHVMTYEPLTGVTSFMRTLDIRDLGCDAGYDDVLALQESLLSDRINQRIPDTLLLLEHRRIFTLGRSAGADHVLWSDAELAQRGIERTATSRGGDVTYHGPGQLVGYPIVHLGEGHLRLPDYIHGLEETLIRALAEFGIAGARDARNRGVWIGNAKIAAIGIRVSRQVAMHGFSLNVNTRLEDYRGIVACGLSNAGVTSMAAMIGREQDMAAVKAAVIRAFCGVLGYSTKAGN